MNREKDYEIFQCDATSVYHTGSGRDYMVTYRGIRCGHLTIHRSGYMDWTFTVGLPRPSDSTQRRLVASVDA